jgi:tripartite-type tricarboxylate transporter receptor subunit TctC
MPKGRTMRRRTELRDVGMSYYNRQIQSLPLEIASMKPQAICTLALLALLGAFNQPVFAAEYPERNITVVVPFPPGGASDVTARLTSNKFSERVGKSVIIENRAGANGSIGAAGVKSAASDGYTLLIGSIGVYAINPVLYKNLKYDPLKDFDLLSLLVRTPNVLVTNPNFPVNSAADLIAHLKKNPNQVTFASSGIGSSDHLTAALFWQKTGTTGLHVPYKGGGPAINDLIGGHASVSFQNLGAVAQHIKAGKLKALAVTGDKRAAALPDVPTAAEAGIADLVVYSWQAAAAPKGLPADVRTKLESEIAAAINSPDVKKQFNDIGCDVVASNGAQFAEFLADETQRWRKVVEAGNITAE